MLNKQISTLYFNNGSGLGTAKSGGTTRIIEISRRLLKRGFPITMVTTEGSYQLFIKEKLHVNCKVVRSSFFKKVESSNWDRVVAYFISTLHSIFLVRKLENFDIVYVPSDYFCDVLPAVFYKWRKKSPALVSMIHHLARPPFRRKGNFVLNFFSFLLQRVSFWIISKYADIVLVYDTDEGEQIKRIMSSWGVPKEKLISVHNGVDMSFIDKVKAQDKLYDACFVGGLRASKGLFDLLPIWKKVVEQYPHAKLVVIGEGTKQVTDEFRSQIREAQLENHIFLQGSLHGEELYRTMKLSKLFLSTSREEGWGIAVCEGLACGLPVVAFHLPAFKFLLGQITAIPLGDIEMFAKECCDKLRLEERELLSQSSASKAFIEKYDWDNIALTEQQVLERAAHV